MLVLVLTSLVATAVGVVLVDRLVVARWKEA